MAEEGIHGPVAALYDVFVDWPGRLGRELPGLRARLDAAGARRVLDVGCGTGQHVRALRAAGLLAHGADPSDDMLAQARALLGSDEGLHRWALGAPVPADLAAAAPFDAAVALGNVWPQVTREADARRGVADLLALVRPGGMLLLGLKAFGVRAASGDPYLPLLAREHAGGRLHFVRFLDFDVPRGEEGERLAAFHMVIAGADVAHHRIGQVRVWDPAELADWFRTRGWRDVRLSARLGEPDAVPTGEDVFLEARAPD